VSDALDYLTPRYLNKTLPDLARVSTDGLVIFAGMCFFLKHLLPSLFPGKNPRLPLCGKRGMFNK
jgi:hypothetical protein